MNELKKYILNHWPSENLESEIIYAYDKMDALDKALDCEGHIYELIEVGGRA
ncbi:MAG: hypothetical protein MJ126_04645 [Lachnospiraceae bacterium]|nr:hypothetical protein [Lachnospiraceae bacterium]